MGYFFHNQIYLLHECFVLMFSNALRNFGSVQSLLDTLLGSIDLEFKNVIGP